MGKGKNFGKSNTSRAFKEVGKEYAEKGNVITLINISTENLVDHPDNGEDITRTSDLEASISELGFIDPIEVTTLGVDEGKYMIVSGRRRRAAGVKVGITTFPCLLRNFETSTQVEKYILFANQHRDSDSDPLLLARRYKMHKAQLESEGFKGSKRNEIARRMNLSAAQADRYEALNNIIEPVWVMISEGKIGVSSVQKMASHNMHEQTEMYDMLNECLEAGYKLTREKTDSIIEMYRSGVKSYSDGVKPTADSELAETRDRGLPLAGMMNTEPAETKEKNSDRGSEAPRQFDPISAEHDKMDENEAAWREAQSGDTKQKTTREEKEAKEESKTAKAILLHTEKLSSCLNDLYTFDSNETELAVTSMGILAVDILNAINAVSVEDETFSDMCREAMSNVRDRLQMFIN